MCIEAERRKWSVCVRQWAWERTRTRVFCFVWFCYCFCFYRLYVLLYDSRDDFAHFFSPVCSLFICGILLYLARSHVRETCTSWSHVNRTAVYAFRHYCVNVYNLRCAMTIYYCRFTNVAFQLPQNNMMNYTLFGASFSGFVFCICELCVDYSFKCDSIRWWCASSYFKCWIIMSARVCRSVFIRSLFRWNSFVLACSMWDKLGIFLISDDTPSLTIEILNAAFNASEWLPFESIFRTNESYCKLKLSLFVLKA